jgi:hypothetical protein
MGALYRFTCPECGNEAEVAGGLDYGMACVVHTVSCPTCQRLSDALVSDRPGDFAALLKTDPKTGDLMEKRIRCGLDGRHTAELWSHPGPGPRCGTTLGRDEEPAVMWD